MLMQGDSGHMVEKRDSRAGLLGSGVVGTVCLVSVHLADVVIFHDSAIPIGRTSCSRSEASMEHWEEGGTRAGWAGIHMEEVRRYLLADVCDVGYKEGIDEASLLEFYVI